MELIACKNAGDLQHGNMGLALLPVIVLQFYVNFGGGISLRLTPAIKSSIVTLPKVHLETARLHGERRAAIKKWLYDGPRMAPQSLSIFTSMAAQCTSIAYEVGEMIDAALHV